jgi:hypothetical protein
MDYLLRQTLSRPASEKERRVLESSLQRFLAHYTREPAEALALLNVGESRPPESHSAPTLAAWTLVCNQVLNLDETLNK